MHCEWIGNKLNGARITHSLIYGLNMYDPIIGVEYH